MTWGFLQETNQSVENRMILECVDMADAHAEVKMNADGGNPFPDEVVEAKMNFLRARLVVMKSWCSLMQLKQRGDFNAIRLFDMMGEKLKECESAVSENG